MKQASPLSRRDWLRLTTAGVIGGSMSGWIEALAADTAANPQRRRSCILLWMTGGPTQMDTFDLKPGHENGGPYQEIATAAPGVKISEHLPGLAKHADRMAIIRSMSTKEGDHGRGTFLMRTGYLPQGPIQYPPLGSLVSKELGGDDAALPNFVSIAANRSGGSSAFGAGFLGPQYAPLVVGDGAPATGRPPASPDDALKVRDLQPAPEVGRAHTDARIALLQGMERDFLRHHPEVAARSHQTAYDRAVRLMQTDAAKAFNLDEEKDALRDAYGRNLFGQGCLLARRLVERGVPFVEVALGGWDTHSQNFEQVKRLSGTLDPAWAALMTDLKDRGLLDTTLIVWMGEFGRTPKINRGQGRDHFPAAWSTVLAGGGIRGGQAVGKTSADGMAVEERPVSAADLMSTVCRALGIDPTKQNNSNLGRPIRIVDKGAQPIREILADG
jgi:uncharacterized protein (DUF1501 family)